MLVCRPRTQRLVSHVLFHIPPSRSSNQAAASTSKSTDSIFTTPESPWDHVFSDIDTIPPPDNTTVSFSGRRKGHGPTQNHLIQRSSGVRHQRASITAREMTVFNEMFDLIFNAVSSKDGKASVSSSPSPSSTWTSPSPVAHAPSSFSGHAPSIGRAGAPINDLFRTLRRRASRTRWTTAIDEELDRKKETMELFNTDHELLQWVTLEVFGESQQWDEEANKAIATSSASTEKTVSSVDSPATSSTSTSTSTSTLAPASGSHKGPPTNHSIYPHLIAHAMRIFRTTYSNPSLSLAIFNHAARVSIPSYVFGCTAPAYNELIEAKWEGWGDLEGICNALEEMRANGVKIDGRTRIVVEKVRREVGEARPVELGETEEGAEEVDVNPLARTVWRELGEMQVMKLLHRIERLALRERSRRSTASPHDESWKNAILQPVEDDGWSFDRWDKEKKMEDRDRRSGKAKRTAQDVNTVDDWTAGQKMAFR